METPGGTDRSLQYLIDCLHVCDIYIGQILKYLQQCFQKDEPVHIIVACIIKFTYAHVLHC